MHFTKRLWERPNHRTCALMSVTVDMTHPDVSELSPLVLTAPNGNTRNLYVSGNWTDGGSQTFEPYSSMYSGHDGQWTLRVADDTAGNYGWLDGWTISATYNTKPTYPIEQSTRQDPFMVPVYGNDVYMVVDKKLPHGTVSVHSETINNSMGLEITNLPSNTLYSITDDDGFEIYGTTGDSGEIILSNENSWANVINPSLKLFDDAFVIRNMAGMSVYDIQNDLVLHVPVSKFDGVVYGTTQYMKLPLMIDTTVDSVSLAVDNCTAVTLSLPYLARNYTAAADKHIWIPVVPGLGVICMSVDGTDLTMRLEDFRSGESAATASNQHNEHSTAPNLTFRTYTHNRYTGATYSPVSGIMGDPIYNSIGVSTGSQFVTTTSGTKSVTVSGIVLGKVDAYIMREYEDSSLTGTVADVEDSSVRANVNVYKNGELAKSVHLGTFTASGHETDTRFMSLPAGDGRERWYSTSNNGELYAIPLVFPWWYCDSTGFSNSDNHVLYKCVYKHNSISNSVAELDTSYVINGQIANNAFTFDVDPGDIIEYRFSARLYADHNSFDAGNDNTANYGNIKMSLELKGVLFDHVDIQN